MATISSLGVGSGLDLNGLIDQLNSAERKKLEPIQRQQKSHQAKISAYGKLQSALTKLQESAAKLNDPKFFQNVSSTVVGSGVKAAAKSDAPPGRYSVQVNELATAQSVAANGVASRTAQLGGGTVSLALDNGTTKEIAIDPAKSSLEDIRKAINDSKSGVTATIVNDGSGTPHRLVLTSNKTGTESAVTAVFSGGLADSLGAGAAVMVEAKNASLTVNGIAITSQTNRVEGAIQGVTLDLEEKTKEDGSVTVVVERNTLAIREGISGFVKAYNDLRKTMDELTSFNADTGAAGELLGDSALRTVESRLRGVMSGGVGQGELRMLSDLGISLQRDGTLKLDEEKMSELVASSPQELGNFFAGENKAGGMAGKLSESLDQVLRDRGLLDNAKRGLESRITGLKDRFDRMERSIEQTMQRYRVQFGQLDAMIANMNQMSDYLFQQFDIMNAQLGRKR
jgi:flagellar hook-associated protein 2